MDYFDFQKARGRITEIKVKGLVKVEKGRSLPTFSILEQDQAILHYGIAPVETVQP